MYNYIFLLFLTMCNIMYPMEYNHQNIENQELTPAMQSHTIDLTTQESKETAFVAKYTNHIFKYKKNIEDLISMPPVTTSYNSTSENVAHTNQSENMLTFLEKKLEKKQLPFKDISKYVPLNAFYTAECPNCNKIFKRVAKSALQKFLTKRHQCEYELNIQNPAIFFNVETICPFKGYVDDQGWPCSYDKKSILTLKSLISEPSQLQHHVEKHHAKRIEQDPTVVSKENIRAHIWYIETLKEESENEKEEDGKNEAKQENNIDDNDNEYELHKKKRRRSI